MLEPDRDSTIILVGNRQEDPDFTERATSRASVVFISKSHPPMWRSQRFPVCEFLLDYPKRLAQATAAVAAFLDDEPVAAVIGQTELGLVPTQHVLRHFCPQRVDDLAAATILRDKSRMRTLMAEHGFPTAGARVGRDAAELLAFLREYDDVIVKPLDGCGSEGVVRVRSVDDVRTAIAVQRALKNERFLMEEYLDGPEYSVETFSFDGHHRVVALTEKITLDGSFVEVAHIVPASLPDRDRDRIAAHTVEFLELVGLHNGPAHTELRLTSRGPRIVESQNRVGGDRINLLVKAVYGIDLMDLTFDWALGRATPLADIPAPNGAAAVRYFVPQPGILRALGGLDALDAAPHVLDWEFLPKAGDRIRLPISSFRRSGFVVAAGATGAEALRFADEAGSLVQLDIEPPARSAPPLAAA